MTESGPGDWRDRWSRSAAWRARWLPLTLVLVVAALIAIPVRLVFAQDRVTAESISSSPSASLYAIVVICQVSRAEDCAALRRDTGDRYPVLAAERSDAQLFVTTAETALVRLWQRGVTCQPGPVTTSGEVPPCTLVRPSASVADVTSSLNGAGFPDPLVRVARADDPAPAGSTVFGVPVKEVCWVGSLGYEIASQIVGRLHTGYCLKP